MINIILWLLRSIALNYTVHLCRFDSIRVINRNTISSIVCLTLCIVNKHLKLCFDEFIFSEKQGKVEAYYKKQEELFEGLNEMETMSKSGFLPGALTEVGPQWLFYPYSQSSFKLNRTVLVPNCGLIRFIDINLRM